MNRVFNYVSDLNQTKMSMVACGADFVPEMYPDQPENFARPDLMAHGRPLGVVAKIKQSYFDSSNKVSRYLMLTWVVY